MRGDFTALLAHNQEELLTLWNRAFSTQHAHTCSKLSAASRSMPLGLVLTATTLADGTWADVLRLASMNQGGVPVIVVSRLVDIDLYLNTLESGASDFIVPPLSPPDPAHVVKGAIGRGFGNGPKEARREAEA